MASSDTIQVAADGTFSAPITNFNKGVDGSREIAKVMVDPTGTGDKNSFVAATMVENGSAAPPTLGTEQISVQLPAGMTCAGTGGKCIVSFRTLSGFGNCVVVQQSSSGTAAAGRRRAFRFARTVV
ncbi:uncharacterized protein BXZ73DRAFT_79968 [Epithele typhae]|uniref:uncharacterized protein n=1 Tax=Epithele typhae TaxID=378194 RepID=UPI002008D88C|nr:uncharacterized protein BXZ73DRAFT_79968 [Epithele typhae]KAH9921192.1 hypothetical protein BXZ73DRAFT_79968 [Epithele typhae]